MTLTNPPNRTIYGLPTTRALPPNLTPPIPNSAGASPGGTGILLTGNIHVPGTAISLPTTPEVWNCLLSGEESTGANLSLEGIAYGKMEGKGFFERGHVVIASFAGVVGQMDSYTEVTAHNKHPYVKS